MCGLWQNKQMELGRYFEKMGVISIGGTSFVLKWRLQLTAQGAVVGRGGVELEDVKYPVLLIYDVSSN